MESGTIVGYIIIGMQDALNLGQGHGTKFEKFLSNKHIKPLIDNELAMVLENPIRFIRPGRGGVVAKGYEATTLTKICRMISLKKVNPLF